MSVLSNAPWSSQPAIGVGVNANSLFARGLIGLYNPAAGLTDFSGHGNDLTNVGAATRVAGTQGVGFKPATSSYFATPDLRPFITSSTGATLMMLLQSGTTANQGILRAGSDTVNMDHYPYSSQLYTSFLAGSRWMSGGTSLVALTSPHVATYRYNPNGGNSAYSLRQNGRTTYTSASSYSFGLPSDGKIWIGSSFTTGSTWYYNGSFALIAIWNRWLSDAEESALASNLNGPWQLFQPPARRLWIPSTSGGASITPDAGTLALTGYAPTLTQPNGMTAGVGSLVIAGYAPSIAQAVTVTPDAGTLSLTGYAPSIAQPIGVAPGVGSIALTGYAPAISQPIGVAPSVGSLSITGYAPTIDQPSGIVPSSGQIILTGYAPTLTQPNGMTAGAGTLSLTGYAPSISQAIIVAPDVGALSIAGYAPVLSQPNALTAGAGQIVITGYAPTVSATSTPTLTQADIDAIAAAVWQYATRDVNVIKMNGAQVIGTGTQGDSWRGVGVSP